MSGSRWCSINAENSTKRNLCVAIALPSQGGTLGGWMSDDTAVDGGFSDVDPLFGYPWANGLTLSRREKPANSQTRSDKHRVRYILSGLGRCRGDGTFSSVRVRNNVCNLFDFLPRLLTPPGRPPRSSSLTPALFFSFSHVQPSIFSRSSSRRPPTSTSSVLRLPVVSPDIPIRTPLQASLLSYQIHSFWSNPHPLITRNTRRRFVRPHSVHCDTHVFLETNNSVIQLRNTRTSPATSSSSLVYSSSLSVPSLPPKSNAIRSVLLVPLHSSASLHSSSLPPRSGLLS